MPPNRFESEVESFLEGSHGDRTHIKRADHHTVTPLCGTLLREKTRPTQPLQRRFHEKTRPARHKTPILGHFSCAGRTFSRLHDDHSAAGRTFSRSHPQTRQSRANNIAHRTQKNGDVETNNTTAHPQQGTYETRITSAPEKHAKNAHFSPAKAMAVSTTPPHRPAKATMVSNHQATWPTGPGCGARGP